MTEESLFLAALEKHTPAERQEFLAEACGTDAALRARVQMLLEADARARGILDRQIVDAPEQTWGYAPNEQPGAVIAGRFKLLEEIGEGGMGTVWVAEQIEPVKRKVAVKLIKMGMDSKSVLARFEAERQALAVMDHPNIAKVLDGGLTETGRPYFVMEYVKGVPITEYCDATRLNVQERLELFMQVCLAVQHAHQKGIVHRDLKPSNILVAPYDDKPVPKVIDFGLAKAMHQSLTERTLHTAHETVLGTPLYMSPEQAQLNNIDVDTRSDVYSLGVLLYELLTGTTPLEKQRFKEAAWDEIKRIIREEDPPRPSTRLSSTTTLPSLAAGRKTEPARLTRLLRGELDWIVMKSLEKDRSRRYESASGFASDIQRYLSGEPVLAAPPSAGYRLRKFATRNWAALATATGLAVFLVLGAAACTLQAVRATNAEHEARIAESQVIEERDRALSAEAEANEQRNQAQAAFRQEARQRKRARQAVDTMYTDVAEKLMPTQARMGPKSREFLEKALKFYEEEAAEYGDDREAQLSAAWASNRVSQVYQKWKVDDKAKMASDRAIALVEGLLIEGSKSSELRAALAHFYSVRAWIPGNAPADLPKALAIFQQLTAEDPLSFENRFGESQVTGVMGYIAGDAFESERLYRRAIEIAEKLARDFPANAPQESVGGRSGAVELNHRANTLIGVYSGDLAWILLVQGGRVSEAERLFHRAISIFQPRAQRDNDAQDWYQVAAYEAALGRIAAGMPDGQDTSTAHFKLARSIAHRLETDYVGLIYHKSSYVWVIEPLIACGRIDEAIDCCREAIALMQRSEPLILANLRIAFSEKGEYDKLIAEFRQAMSSYAADPVACAQELAILGSTLLRQRKWHESELILRECLSIRERYVPDDFKTFNAQSLLGGALLGQENFANAEPLLRSGYEGIKQRETTIPVEGRVRIPEALDRLIELYTAIGKPEEVKKWQAERAKYPEVPPISPEKK